MLLFLKLSVNIDIIGIEAHKCIHLCSSKYSFLYTTHNVINFYDCISANIENTVHNKFLCMLGHNITIIH